MPHSLSWIALVPVLALSAPEADLDQAIKTLRQVDKEGAGNAAARDAWRVLIDEGDAAAVPRILGAMSGANPLAENWLQNAADTLCAKLAADGAVPREALEKFLADTAQAPRARTLAFAWLVELEPAARERWLERFRDDPSVDLRREAVASLLAQASAADGEKGEAEARSLYAKALAAARDPDQIDTATKRLRELGEEVDLARHFGFIRSWHVIGPFDNGEKRGFAASYPPEQEIELDRTYTGKSDEVAWKTISTGDEYGNIDLNREVAHEKGVVAYAYHEFPSSDARKAEIRIATVNAWKLWVNGELAGERDEYHHGTRIDHYRVPVQLVPGRNRILLKSLQNEQTEDYADRWSFQLRVSDATGTAILPEEVEK